MRPALVVLGGSTPFTAGLVEALRDSEDLPACRLRLFGRDSRALERMRGYAEQRLGHLGWSCDWATSLDQALDGASVVLNQIRFGDLSGRASDEAFAEEFGMPADETLGPCGLRTALRAQPKLKALAQTFRRVCPGAWLLNLSNPLSVTTRALCVGGAVDRTLGLCELPSATALELCRLLALDPATLQWSYLGLNHRGFLVSLKSKGAELLPTLPRLLGERSVFGIEAREVEALGAVPLKYFRLTQGAPTETGRARFLLSLKEKLANEMDGDLVPPPSLKARRLDWYQGAVVPALRGLFSDREHPLTANVLCEDGLVWERQGVCSRSGFRPHPRPVASPVEGWLNCWARHEQAVVEAIDEPSRDRLELALSLDPVVQQRAGSTRIREMAQALEAGA